MRRKSTARPAVVAAVQLVAEPAAGVRAGLVPPRAPGVRPLQGQGDAAPQGRGVGEGPAEEVGVEVAGARLHQGVGARVVVAHALHADDELSGLALQPDSWMPPSPMRARSVTPPSSGTTSKPSRRMRTRPRRPRRRSPPEACRSRRPGGRPCPGRRHQLRQGRGTRGQDGVVIPCPDARAPARAPWTAGPGDCRRSCRPKRCPCAGPGRQRVQRPGRRVPAQARRNACPHGSSPAAPARRRAHAPPRSAAATREGEGRPSADSGQDPFHQEPRGKAVPALALVGQLALAVGRTGDVQVGPGRVADELPEEARRGDAARRAARRRS